MRVCSHNTAKRFRRRQKIKRWPIVLSVILIFVTFGLLHLNYNVNPLIKSACKEKATANVLESFNLAATNELTNSYDYNNLVNIVTDSQGNVVLIQTNSVLINLLTRGIALDAQKRIDESGASVKIPLGAFSGFTFLSGLGRLVDVNVQPVSTLTTSYESKFISAGLNQTLHTIYLTANVEMLLALPGQDFRFSVTEQIILCENVIIGKVPSIYFQNN